MPSPLPFGLTRIDVATKPPDRSAAKRLLTRADVDDRGGAAVGETLYARRRVRTPFMVMWDADAAAELASLTSKEEKKALFNVIDKLRQLGERLVPPHMKPLKGGSGLRELRPRQGRTHVRAIYVRAGDQYVILSLCLKPDKADWEAALAAARDRSSLYTTVER